MSSPITQAIKQICEEKKIPYASVLETIEAALASAFRKDFGDREKPQNIKVQFDPETARMRVFDVKTVVEDMELPEEETEEKKVEVKEKKKTKKVEKKVEPEVGTATGEESEEPKFNPKTMIMISEAVKIKPDAIIGEEIRTELEVPGAFGRMAAQTAKQVIMQKIREVEREVVYNEFKGQEHQVLIATVQRREGRVVLLDLGRATAVMPPDEQSSVEHYNTGERMKVYVKEVELTSRGPQIVVSRTHPELVRKLFEVEIPEVANGVVEIKSISREAGSRSKVAVSCNDSNIDPIGSCIGQRGTRIQTITHELGGEKIDIVLWDENQSKFISGALSPAKITSVELNEKEKIAVAYVPADQLSLAIGKGGQNVRLAARLTGWKLNVVETKVAAVEVAEEKKDDKKAEVKVEEPATEIVPEEGTLVEGKPAEEKKEEDSKE